ncbi:hypothetical protein ABJ851_000600 [Shigella flexneri]|nr:hypothetical protein [Escherichia coli]
MESLVALAGVKVALDEPDFFAFLNQLNVDNALDLRDDSQFDERWMCEFNTVQRRSYSDEVINVIDTLREKSFKLAFRITANSDISARISDDIELICKRMVMGEQQSWSVKGLWSCYCNGQFPCHI